MPNELIEAAFGRLNWLAEGYRHTSRAVEPLDTAAGLLLGTALSGESYAREAASLNVLTRVHCERLAHKAAEVARQLGWQVATYIIAPMARDSGTEPVVWLTGNSMVPPLRELTWAGVVWNLDLPELWEAFCEGVESRLNELNVHMAAPDYDNALYVVDLSRFEYVDEPDAADSLQDEWRPTERSN